MIGAGIRTDSPPCAGGLLRGWPKAHHPGTRHLGDSRMKKLLVAFGTGACMFSLWLGSADARPGYMKAFTETYPNVTGAATAKCNVCHAGTDKKMRNDYGKALGAALGEPNVKDAAKITAGLKKVEETNAGFAEKLKAGKLPVE